MPYLALFEHDGRAHGGLIPELNVSATGKTSEQVRERLQQGAALALHELAAQGHPVPTPHFQALSDLPDELRADFPDATVEMLDAAPINPLSLEIERAIEASGLTDSEVARRMNSSPAAVHRLQDYFYWGHSIASLRRLAEVLGLKVEVKLEAA